MIVPHLKVRIVPLRLYLTATVTLQTVPQTISNKGTGIIPDRFASYRFSQLLLLFFFALPFFTSTLVLLLLFNS